MTVHSLVLAFAILLFMTVSLSDLAGGAVYELERPRVREAPGFLLVTSREEREARQLYDRVMQEFRKKDYEAALAGFQFFLELYETSRLAASAQFWVGECEYRLGRYRDSIESFSQALQVSQQRPKLAGATLRMALAYEKLGDTEASRILLERLISDFSDTPEVEIARKRLGPRPEPPPDPGMADQPGDHPTDQPMDQPDDSSEGL